MAEPLTPEALDRAVTSLRNVGGLYELVALHVESANRPHVRKPMIPHYDDGMTAVHLADCLEVLRALPDNSIDAVVTDPPYGLSNTDPGHIREALTEWLGGNREFLPAVSGGGFMGKAWDSFIPPVAVWDECYRVLKPGGHVLAFAGSRTFDLMTLAVRLAGFDIRDSIAWLYGSGFPKSLDVSKAIDKAAGVERPVVGESAKRDSYGPGAGNAIYGSGPDHAGVQKLTAPATPAAAQWQGWGTALKPAFEPIIMGRKPLVGTVAANVLAHGTGALNIDATRIGTKLRFNPAAGNKPGGASLNMSAYGMPEGASGRDAAGRWPANVILDEHQAAELDDQSGTLKSGSRRKGDHALMGYQGAGVTEMPEIVGGASRFFYVAKAPKSERPVVDGVAHATVKPLALMRHLIRLVAAEGAVILEPFAGSGTTVEAAILEDRAIIAVERETDYWPLIRHRIARGNGVLEGLQADGVL